MKRDMEGEITFSRPRGSHGPDYIQVEVSDKLSGTRVISVKIGLEQFTEALFGLSCIPCKFDLSAEKVGLKREHKEEYVPVSSEQYYASTPLQRANVAAQVFAPFEIDGWKGRIDDLFNHHRRGLDGARVTFVRYVEAGDGEED